MVGRTVAGQCPASKIHGQQYEKYAPDLEGNRETAVVRSSTHGFSVQFDAYSILSDPPTCSRPGPSQPLWGRIRFHYKAAHGATVHIKYHPENVPRWRGNLTITPSASCREFPGCCRAIWHTGKECPATVGLGQSVISLAFRLIRVLLASAERLSLQSHTTFRTLVMSISQ
jgi:hypothetical protein